jgi:hypothetical protein
MSPIALAFGILALPNGSANLLGLTLGITSAMFILSPKPQNPKLNIKIMIKIEKIHFPFGFSGAGGGGCAYYYSFNFLAA